MNARLVGTLTREAQVLLLSTAGPERDGALRELLASEIRWPVLLELARREGATAALWQLVADFEVELPREVEETLRRSAWLIEFRQAMLEQRLGEALAVLGAAAVPVVLLKGTALVGTVYRSFADRPMADLDLLVRPSDAGEAQRLLIANGWRESGFASREQFYRGHHHLPPLEDGFGAGTSLELHTDLFFLGHPFTPLLQRMWESAEPASERPASVRLPHLHHQLLHLCAHYCWSHMLSTGTWRTIRDLRAILATGQVGWEEVLSLASEARALTCCYWPLRLAQSLAGVAVPDVVLYALRPPLRESTLAVLERHFAHEVLATESLCPSVRLGHAAWSLAVQPEWCGHGAVRPWDREPHFHERASAPEERRGGSKLLSHLRQLAAWRRYLASLFGAAPVARHASAFRVAPG